MRPVRCYLSTTGVVGWVWRAGLVLGLLMANGGRAQRWLAVGYGTCVSGGGAEPGRRGVDCVGRSERRGRVRWGGVRVWHCVRPCAPPAAATTTPTWSNSEPVMARCAQRDASAGGGSGLAATVLRFAAFGFFRFGVAK